KMFYFLAPLRHPNNASNYKQVLGQLELTIRSVCAQKTQHPYKFLVVCNEAPDISYDSEKVEFLVVDFPPAGTGRGTEQQLTEVMTDKGAKVAAGLLHLKEERPERIFLMDADDWVNNTVVQHVMSNLQVKFWYANKGLLVNAGTGTYVRKYGVCRYCGSTFIYDYESLLAWMPQSTSISSKTSKDRLTASIDPFYLQKILGNHRHQFGFLAKHEQSIKPLPQTAVAWIVNTGENHSGTRGAPVGLPLTDDVLMGFGLDDTLMTVSVEPATVLERLASAKLSLESRVGWALTDKSGTKV
ncbi:hypothetical protein N9H37_01440, partial [Congregibacter sp.]